MFVLIVKSRFSIFAASLLAFAPLAAMAQVSVWTYHANNQRTGLNANETILNLTNVNAATFGKLFSQPVDGYVYAQPLYVPNLNIPGKGLHNVFFIATESNSVYAFDADSAGAAGGLLWKTNLGPPAVTTITGGFINKNFGTRYSNNSYTDITPRVGITGTPVIDTNTGTIYLDAFTGELGGGVTNYFHRIHALNLTNGAEKSFSPVIVAASVPGNGTGSVSGFLTFSAKQHSQRPALTLAGGRVYVAYAGNADTNPYHGWVLGYNATNLQLLTNYVFCTTPNSAAAQYGDNSGEGGIWMGGGGLCVDENTNLIFEVGNGIFNATNGSAGTEYSDSFVKLSTTNGLKVSDYFTPYDQASLAAGDTDLGSGGMLLLPDQSGSFPHLMLGAGKAGKIYLINRDQFTSNNGHFNASSGIDFIVQTNYGKVKGSFATPSYFNGRIYYAGTSSDNLKAIPVNSGLLSNVGVLTNTARTFAFPGATTSISANGTNSGIVWALAMGSPAVLLACNATNFSAELYNSSQAAGSRDQLASGTKFAAPIVADGKVFVGNSNSVSVFGLLAGTFSFSAAAYNVNEANTTATITVNRSGGTNGAAQVSYATVAGGSAVDGVNYVGVSGALNWAAGESGAKTFVVPILNDGQASSNHTVNLTLSNPTNPASALGLQTTAVLTIIEPPTSVWQLAHFGANANNATIAGDAADPDADGSANLLEYAFASDPNVAGTNLFTGTLVGPQFQLHFPRNTSASDLTYLVQLSGDLSVWNNLLTYTAASGWVTNLPGASVSESAPVGVPPDQSVNVTATTSTNVTTGASAQFLRLQIHR